MGSLTTLLQLVAAFLIFAAGYLVLLLSVIVCFAIVTGVCKVGSLALAYTVKSASLDHKSGTWTASQTLEREAEATDLAPAARAPEGMAQTADRTRSSAVLQLLRISRKYRFKPAIRPSPLP